MAKRKVLPSFSSVLLLLAALAVRPEGPSKTLESRVREASLFKNGLAFVVREAEAPGAGDYLLTGLPVPAHGTFWILPEPPAVLEEAVAMEIEKEEAAKAWDIPGLLRASVGRRVSLRTADDGWVTGKVEAAPEPSAGGRESSPRLSLSAGGEPQPLNLVLLKTDQGVLALQPSSVTAVRGEDLKDALVVSKPATAVRLRLSSGGRIGIAYLARGLAWAPSYRVEISGPKEAALSAKAEIINDAEEMRGADVRFVTGFPNLAYSEADDPVARKETLEAFLRSLARLSERGPSRHAPPVAQQAMLNMPPMDWEEAPLPAGALGEWAEDLFLYPRPGVTLKPGERGYYPLFEKRVPLEHVYLWEIADSTGDAWSWREPEREESAPRSKEEVWHALRLSNTSGLPWTTAPAMTVQGGKLLGQDTLFYTPAGSKTLVKITRSMEVLARHREIEVERQRAAKTEYSGRQYDLVTVKGELRITNKKGEAVTLLAKRGLSGEVLEAGRSPKVEKSARGVWSLNPRQVLEWEIPLAAGESVEVEYRYRLYVSR